MASPASAPVQGSSIAVAAEPSPVPAAIVTPNTPGSHFARGASAMDGRSGRGSDAGSDDDVHVHGAGCGHTALRHGDHIGYLENGVLHCVVDEAGAAGSGRVEYETHVIHLDTLLCSESGCRRPGATADPCQHQASGGQPSGEQPSGEQQAQGHGHSHGGDASGSGGGVPSTSARGGRHKHSASCDEHQHGPRCGHERVPHGNHFDFLVGNELHHPHGDHCDHHGDITVLELTDIDTASALGDEADNSSISRSVYAGLAHMQLRRNLARVAMARAQQGGRDGLRGRKSGTVAAVPGRSDAHGHSHAEGGHGHSHGGDAGHKKGHAALITPAADVKQPWYKDRDLLRFFLMFFLTGGYFLVELIYGMLIGSLALQADAFHMASDLIALVVGFYSLSASRRSPTAIASYGWTRMEVIGALMNGTFLMATCFNISLEAIHRFQELDEIEEQLGPQADLLMKVALIGLAVNVVGLFIFGHGGGGHGHSHGGSGGGHGHSHGGSSGAHGHSHSGSGSARSTGDKKAAKKKAKRNMNVHGVFLHVLGDALGSVGVVVSGLVIEYGEGVFGRARFLADPLASLLIVMLIMAGTVPLVRRCVRILLQHAPMHVGVDALREELTAIEGVLDVHDFHVWQLTEQKIVCSLHAICRGGVDFMSLSDDMKLRLHRAGIHASTIQPEFVPAELILDLESADVERCHEPMCDDVAQCAAAMCCATGKAGAAPARGSTSGADATVTAHHEAETKQEVGAGHGHSHGGDGAGHGHSHHGSGADEVHVQMVA